jgi:hypothetical protein
LEGLATLSPFGLFYGHWKYFMAIFGVIWYIFLLFGILDQEKSGNPGLVRSLDKYFSLIVAMTDQFRPRLKTYQWLASTLGTKRDCATFYYSYN